MDECKTCIAKVFCRDLKELREFRKKCSIVDEKLKIIENKYILDSYLIQEYNSATHSLLQSILDNIQHPNKYKILIECYFLIGNVYAPNSM